MYTVFINYIMSKESNDKGQQDRSNGKYDPPRNPGIFSSREEKEQYYRDKEDYDTSWEVTRAQQDQNEHKYNPPSTPSILDSKGAAEKKWREKDAYDQSWEDSQKNEDDQKEKSGCFISSACIEAKSLPDDCYELQILRDFRDTYMKSLPDSEFLIKEYYSSAPDIVKAIEKSSQKHEIYNWLYLELVNKSVLNIEIGNYNAAFKNYKSIFEYLKFNFLNK